ncbi:hypothetical protein H0H87_000164 [Tephrocybe sp. NHM501043]|nr:hypothetical protein H0H87_000164 [Tephrocybe sp. NHM501043]
MSEHWNPLGLPATPEFFVSVELYLSSAAALALNKQPNPPQRKRRDKELSAGISAGNLPEPRKVKGKRSSAVLESNDPQIQQKNPVGSRSPRELPRILGGKRRRWTSNHTAEPVYLHFPNTELCNTWLALLRSYAVPEIYGRLVSPADGGSYRMWRQLELTVIQGRGLGTVKLLEKGGTGDGGEPDVVDFAVSCHVYLNGILCGRTSEKKGVGSPDWHENLTFRDLPPFDSLVLLIRRDKKPMKSATLGSVTIPLAHFRRGEYVEGWFPVLHSGPTASDIQVGELRLKLLVFEEIILPHSTYASLLESFNARNLLDWIDDFENKLKVKTVSSQLMSLAVHRNVVISHVQELALREIDEAPPSHHTLFRGNTSLTKVMELSMNWYGKGFLEASVGGVIRKLCREKVAIEVDPARRGKGPKDIERNFELLTSWCQEFLDQIYAVRTECPQELRILFETLRTLVEKRYKPELSKESHQNMQYRSVTAFCFLRFFVPAVLHPHLFGFQLAGMPPAPVLRSLTLIAKVLQSVANLNTVATANIKEEYMRGMRGFIVDNTPAMIDYILVVSTPTRDLPTPQVSDLRREQLDIETHLYERAATMPILNKEAVPQLPYLLDIPRHSAVIASAIIRNTQELQARTRPLDPADEKLNDFCSKCLDVEEQALLRVSQLRAKISSGRQSAPFLGKWLHLYLHPYIRPAPKPSFV